MLKPLDVFGTNLLSPAAPADTVLHVPQEAVAALMDAIPDGDHTYLMLSDGAQYEWVKVFRPTAVSENLTVIRAQLGTTAKQFDEACLDARVTPAMVEAIVTETEDPDGGASEACPRIGAIEFDAGTDDVFTVTLEDIQDCPEKRAKVVADLIKWLAANIETPLSVASGKLGINLCDTDLVTQFTPGSMEILINEGCGVKRLSGQALLDYIGSCNPAVTAGSPYGG